MSAAESPAGHDPRLEEILTLAEAAAYLRVPEDALVKLADDGAVPARRIGGEWRFLRPALNDWIRYSGRPFWKGGPFPPELLLDSSFAEELLFVLEKRLLHKLETSPRPGSKEAVRKHFGVFKGDRDLEEQLANLRARREAQ
jgi:excisionase family DNA binding protein